MKTRLKEILLKKSVITNKEFTLASGKKSNFYVYLKSDPNENKALAQIQLFPPLLR